MQTNYPPWGTNPSRLPTRRPKPNSAPHHKSDMATPQKHVTCGLGNTHVAVEILSNAETWTFA
eukprot:3190301-Karenia_brevis.AAC.1